LPKSPVTYLKKGKHTRQQKKGGKEGKGEGKKRGKRRGGGIHRPEFLAPPFKLNRNVHVTKRTVASTTKNTKRRGEKKKRGVEEGPPRVRSPPSVFRFPAHLLPLLREKNGNRSGGKKKKRGGKKKREEKKGGTIDVLTGQFIPPFCELNTTTLCTTPEGGGT